MDIRNTRELKTFAAQRLENARDSQRILLIYAGITLALMALVTVVNYCLGLQINRTTGLGSLGTRSMLSTVQTFLPLAQMAFLMCLDLGYMSAMLRVARGQYASPNSLRLGFDRFWPLLRCTLLQGLIYAGIFFVSVYAAVLIYLMTPLSKPAMELLTPLVTEAAVAGQTAIALDDATYNQLVPAMAPAIALCGILFCAISTPIAYQYRMVNYVLIDRPACGAIAAMRESRKMMKGKRFKLFRLDLGLWWYYAALVVSTVVCYGDQILPALGIELPFSADVSYFLFYGLCLAVEFAIYYFLRNRVEVTYALAYDAVKPEEPKDNGVVLGNIFQM